ncbi:MAG: caspase family protein [Bryobacteraceae bacterium]
MNNWAVVIGVDRYAAPHLNLKGAVRDALSMASFLTEGPDPLVARARVKLLLSRTDGSPAPGPEWAPVEATRKNIVEAFKDVVKKPAGRLFVHFSGHGLMAPGATGGEALLPSDFEPEDPGFSIRLDGIRDYLRISHFDEQFFFIDACRNTPIEGNFNIGQFPVTPDPVEMRPQVQQFVFCGTLRGVAANEDRSHVNDERGVFTEPLLRGLAGEGTAKRYDEDEDAYLVTAGRLLEFLQGEVRRKVIALGLAKEGDVWQKPRLQGEIEKTEMTLVRIAPDRIPEVELRFKVTPPEAAVGARVTVRRELDRQVGPPVGEDTAIALAPRDYRVVVASPDFEPEKPSWGTDLYEDRLLVLPMREAGLELLGPGGGPGGDPGPGGLDCRSGNPLSVVRLLDVRGRLVGVSGDGRLRMEDLQPGVYRAQWIGADGTVMERTVELDEGSHEVVEFDPPAQAPLRLRGVKADGQGIRMVPGRGLRRLTAGVHETRAGGVLLATPVIEGRVTAVSADGEAIVFSGSDAEDLARVEIAERYYRRGLHEAVLALLGGLAEADPMAAMLAGIHGCRWRCTDGSGGGLAGSGRWRC